MSRRERLRLATRRHHEALDRLIDEKNHFESLNGYGAWLLSGYNFHCDMQMLLAGSAAATVLPLAGMLQRTALLKQDLADLDLLAPNQPSGTPPAPLGTLAAFGTLYVTEGASLGARVLLVRAKKLGLSEHRGARQLAYAAHNLSDWRTFLDILETLECRPDEENLMIAAAQQAFTAAATHWRQG